MTHRLLIVLCAVSLPLALACDKKEARRGEAGSPRAIRQVSARSAQSAPLRVGGAVGGVVVGEGVAASSPSQVPVPQQQKLIHQGEATLEVASVEAALTRLRDLTREAGGYTTTETRSRDYQRVNQGKIECRIPAGKLDSITAALKSLGTIESLTLSTSDITEEYFDLEIRLRNQRALETRLLALLGRPSNKLSDLLDAERELARVRGEIDQMEGRRRFWDNRVALSSLSVTVHEPVPTVGGNEGGALSMLGDAFAESANNFVSAIAGIIAFTGSLVPIVAVVILVGWILMRARRWRRIRRAAKEAAVTAASAHERR